MIEILPLSPAATHYKDRTTGLTLFGVATILLGGLCALLIPLMVAGQATAAKTTGIPPNYQSAAFAAGLYGMMAVVMVWLGYGSIMARRWARTLLLILAGSWLLMGVISMAFMVITIPIVMESILANQPAGQPQLPPGVMPLVMGLVFLIMGVIFIVLPGIWVLFYRSRHVKATCEARDPVERWTDRCPVPVLTISVWLAISVPMLLLMPVAYRGVMPFFGVYLSGLPGSLFYLASAVVTAYSGWAVYRLDPKGWWVTLLSFTLMLISGVVTYLRQDMTEMYRLMGFPEQQLEQMRAMGKISQPLMIGWMVFMEVLLVASMLYVKKHFRKPVDPAR